MGAKCDKNNDIDQEEEFCTKVKYEIFNNNNLQNMDTDQTYKAYRKLLTSDKISQFYSTCQGDYEKIFLFLLIDKRYDLAYEILMEIFIFVNLLTTNSIINTHQHLLHVISICSTHE